MRTARIGATLSLTFLAACAFGKLDLNGRRCPCAPGYTCVADTCIVDSDLGGMDASRDADTADDDATDAGAIDSGALDSGAIDGGTIDGGAIDAGTIDGGAIDTGVDASPDAGVDAGACHTQSLLVLAAQDDGDYEVDAPGTWFPDGDGTAVHCGAWEGPPTGHFPIWCAFRFQLAQAVPATATSVSIDLTLWASGTDGWPATVDPDYALNVYVEHTAAATPVVSASDAAGRIAALTGPTRWPASGGLTWGAAGARTSSELAPAFSSLRSSGALAAGAHVQVWATAVDPSLPAYVMTPTYVGDASYISPILTIRWCD